MEATMCLPFSYIKIFEYEFSFVTSYVFSLNETIMYIKTIRFLW